MNPDKYRPIEDAVKVFLDHEDFIRKCICFYVHDEDEADDLFQDFFLFLIRNLLPMDIRNIESYLYRMITNYVIYSLRRKKKYKIYLREYVRRTCHSVNQKTPKEFILETEDLIATFKLIQKYLPRTEARAVRLRYIDDLDTKEIAKKMGVRTSTVRGYVSEGLSRIRRLLGDNETTSPGIVDRTGPTFDAIANSIRRNVRVSSS